MATISALAFLSSGPATLLQVAQLAFTDKILSFKFIVSSLTIINTALLLFVAWLFTNMLAQYGRVVLRLEAIEERKQKPRENNGNFIEPPTKPSTPTKLGLPPGTPAPNFSLPVVNGESVAFSNEYKKGDITILIFVDPRCGPCEALMPTIQKWQQTYDPALKFIVVSTQTSDKGGVQFGKYKALKILVQKEYEVAKMYECYGTPGAVAVDDSGFFATWLAPGAEAIAGMIEEIAATVNSQSDG
ncbi:thiol-disulfide isomerase/thioredoxin [Azospirillum canadense]|nr:redoxin domain-containing protein [Azospirillum canadense]MCW2240782.1 thiol-disulfide isomerase/thioredoxin [Azospirillum canadense]